MFQDMTKYFLIGKNQDKTNILGQNRVFWDKKGHLGQNRALWTKWDNLNFRDRTKNFACLILEEPLLKSTRLKLLLRHSLLIIISALKTVMDNFELGWPPICLNASQISNYLKIASLRYIWSQIYCERHTLYSQTLICLSDSILKSWQWVLIKVLLT